MGLARDPVRAGAENDVVLDHRIRRPLDSVVPTSPHHIPLDDILRTVPVGTVPEDAGVVGVVNHVVADDASITAKLEFNTVALSEPKYLMSSYFQIT